MKKIIVKMKLMSKKFVGVLFLLIGFALQAQTPEKAKALLDKVSAKVKTYKNIQIDFKYNLQNAKENINQDSKGNVTLSGNQYILNFMGVSKMCDGAKIYTISKEDEEVSIASVGKGEEDNDTPEKMLTFFNKGFKYSWDIAQNVKGKKIQYIKLIPISSKDDRKQILVGVDTKTNTVYNTITIGKNGTRVTLTVNSFKTNVALPKNHFTFVKAKYPNYYINNLD
ncbi:outer membrane lipoprotein carrier protein LolA [Flavobacterium sp. HXWNR70]|uniref:Outer membrane lipoprotein carrier protein LolA n=2 Tax=Flavobacterium luminosum TaxID=2949086 RepID=A0ABT0TRX2_9FLAO|nr:outer membrane lipoprotein carrier protein LolA [Flavobacterium sp. HXWNR70]MCL9810046.1 outer membrane lipoprotein carrier protein LolA [Flavobacterium sp. HXWNR70]